VPWAGRTILTHQFVRRGDADGGDQGARYGAALDMQVVDAFDNFPLVLAGTQTVVGVNAFQHEHVTVQFNFTGNFRSQVQVAGIDLARFQRTPEGPGQSAARRSYNIVKSGRSRWKLVCGNFVVFGYRRMHAERHGLLLGRQIRPADRSDLALNTHLRGVNDLAGC